MVVFDVCVPVVSNDHKTFKNGMETTTLVDWNVCYTSDFMDDAFGLFVLRHPLVVFAADGNFG